MYQKLIDTKTKIQVVEIGCGVPFTAKLLEFNGASNTLVRSYCPYAKSVQELHGVTKSVSLDTVKRFVDPAIISIVHTGAIYDDYSHGYIGIDNDHIHYSTKVSNRLDGINASREAIEWAVNYFLFKEETEFKHCIDMISTNDLDLLFRYSKLLCYHNNQFVRPESILRSNKTIFRGSFNPPHKYHEAIGNGAIWEVTRNNFSKGPISSEDLMHRIKMVNSLGIPALVTRECPKFLDLVSLLPDNNVEFIVGDDTFDRIEDETQKKLNFRVVKREGTSSTEIRTTSNFDNVSPQVASYIRKHGLYRHE